MTTTRKLFVAASRLQTAAVRLVGSVLQLGLNFLLAHLFGAATLGRFLVFVAITNIAIAVAGGLPNLLMRYASHRATERKEHYVGWLWRHSLMLGGAAMLVALACAAVGLDLGRDLGLAVSGLIVQRASSAGVKSMGRPNLGILLDTALYPFLLIALAVWVHLQNQQIDDQALRVAYGAALWLVALIGVLVGRKGPGAVRTAWLAPRRVPRALYAEIASVTVGAASNLIGGNAAVAMAPFFLTDSEVGSLGVALRVAGFATTLLVSLNAYYGPAFVRADSPGELSSLLRQSQALSTALYIPIPLLCLILPQGWLAAVDPALGSVKTLVAILSVGYLVNAVTGLCSTILIMRGHAREFALVNALGATLTVAAVASGGALAGGVGIAIGLSTAMALSNLWTYHVARKTI